MTRPRIRPTVFDLVNDHAEEVRGAVAGKGTAPSPSALLAFCVAFYAQFFRSVVKVAITGLNEASQQVAATARLQIVREHPEDDRLPLIRWFEQLCAMEPDLAGEIYVEPGGDPAKEFQSDHIVTLLERAFEWADKAGEDEVRAAADLALSNWREAIAVLYE